MKPTKNRIFCSNIHRVKMLFASKEKADNFIRFNADNMALSRTHVPIRSYYCPACGGWHVTHKSESEEYIRADDLQQKAYELGRFITDIKTHYDEGDWSTWKAGIEEARRWMSDLAPQVEHQQLLREAQRQLEHYTRMVESAERKEKKKENRTFQVIDMERKQLCDEMRDRMKSLDVDHCQTLASRLHELMQMPAFDRSEENIKTHCQRLVTCFTDKDLYGKLQWSGSMIKQIINESSSMSVDEIRDAVNRINSFMVEMKIKQAHPHIIEPFNDGILRLLQIKNKKAVSPTL